MRLNSVLSNFVSSVIRNPITVIFLFSITVYSIFIIIQNRTLYKYINENLKEIQEHKQKSIFYSKVLEKYNLYRQENTYAEVNITSLTEEIVSGLKHHNKYILDKVNFLKNSSSICILLGVLGTFVGLSTMLLTVDTNNIINSLPQTISSMQTAFTTSIFGIVFSIFISSRIRAADCEHILIQLMLKIENLLTAEVTHSKAMVIDSKIEAIKNIIIQINDSVEGVENFDQIAKDLNEFNENFMEGIYALKQLLKGSESYINTFNQSVRKLDKQLNILNIKFGSLFDKYSNQEVINKEILLEIKECRKNISYSTDNQAQIKDFIKNINSEFSIYENAAEKLLEHLLTQDAIVIQSQKELNDNKVDLNNSIINLSNIVSMTSKEIQDKIDMIFTYIDIYNEAINTKPDEKYSQEEIYEIDNELELSKPEKLLTVVKSIRESDIDD